MIQIREIRDYFANEVEYIVDLTKVVMYEHTVITKYLRLQPELSDEACNDFKIMNYIPSDFKYMTPYYRFNEKEQTKNFKKYIFFDNNVHLFENKRNLIVADFEIFYFNFISYRDFDTNLYLFQEDENWYRAKEDELIKKGVSQAKYKMFNDASDLLSNKHDADTTYDTVIVTMVMDIQFSYYKLYLQSKVPNYYLFVTCALSKLRKGGTLVIFLPRSSFLNNALHKLLHLLSVHFDDYIFDDNSTVLTWTGFKANVPADTMDALRSISIETRPYAYLACMSLRHLHYLLSNNRDNTALGYRVDLDEVGLRDAFKDEEPMASMQVLHDVNLQVEPTIKGTHLISELDRYYRNMDKYIYETTERYVLRTDPKDYHTSYVEDEHREKMLYERTMTFIKYFERNGIPYNKANLAYIKQYNESTMTKLFSLSNTIIHLLMKYRDESELSVDEVSRSSSSSSSWRSTALEDVQKMTGAGFEVKQSLVEKYETDNEKNKEDKKDITEAMRRIKAVSEDFTRGVSAKVSGMLRQATGGGAVPVSNAFVKLWEIYELVPQVLALERRRLAPTREPDRSMPKAVEDLRVFHIAEAPGQWIYCTTHYLRTRSKPVGYDWRAMSLDSQHTSNKAKYGEGIFADQYGFIRGNPDHWVYGADGTGDFTNPENIRWYREYVREWCGGAGPDLITGDAGMNGEGVGLRDLQLIDLCQMLMVLACGSVGSSSITKHFLPYIRNIPESFEASGFFMCLLYCYHWAFDEVRLVKPLTSNPDSGEFYVVCTGQREIPDEVLNGLVDRVAGFETNECLFDESLVPDEFQKQVVEFVRRMSDNISVQYDIQNTLLTCLTDDSEVIQQELQCSRYLGSEEMESVRKTRVQKWIEMYNLDFDEGAIITKKSKKFRGNDVQSGGRFGNTDDSSSSSMTKNMKSTRSVTVSTKYNQYNEELKRELSDYYETSAKRKGSVVQETEWRTEAKKDRKQRRKLSLNIDDALSDDELDAYFSTGEMPSVFTTDYVPEVIGKDSALQSQITKKGLLTLANSEQNIPTTSTSMPRASDLTSSNAAIKESNESESVQSDDNESDSVHSNESESGESNESESGESNENENSEMDDENNSKKRTSSELGVTMSGGNPNPSPNPSPSDSYMYYIAGCKECGFYQSAIKELKERGVRYEVVLESESMDDYRVVDGKGGLRTAIEAAMKMLVKYRDRNDREKMSNFSEHKSSPLIWRKNEETRDVDYIGGYDQLVELFGAEVDKKGQKGGTKDMKSMKLQDPHFETLGREKSWEMRPRSLDEKTGKEKRLDWVEGTRVEVHRNEPIGEEDDSYVVVIEERREYPASPDAFEVALKELGYENLLPRVEGVTDASSGAEYYRGITPSYGEDERERGVVAWRVRREE